MLGERANAPSETAPRPVAGADRVAATLSAALGASANALVAHDPEARLGDDPESVHQMRVATRKIRSHLRTFFKLVDEPWALGLREELQWLGGLLGDVRDAEVLLDRLENNVSRLPSSDRDSAELLLADLRAHHADARDSLLAGMRSDRYVTLLDQLVAAAHRPRLLLRIDDQADDDILRGLVRGPVRSLRDAVSSLPDDPPDAALHEVRIQAKRARYATEAVVPVFGKRARALARALVEIQDVLGEHQDAVIAADWLRDAAVKTDDERVGFAAGQLAALEHTAALAARKRWPATWAAADKKKLRTWL
jgi:CHAD domain-containing protein